MNFIELTIASHDELNGEKTYIRTDDIRRIVEINFWKDKIPDVTSGEKPQRISLIYISNGMAPVQAQRVYETPVQLRKLLEKNA